MAAANTGKATLVQPGAPVFSNGQQQAAQLTAQSTTQDYMKARGATPIATQGQSRMPARRKGQGTVRRPPQGRTQQQGAPVQQQPTVQPMPPQPMQQQQVGPTASDTYLRSPRPTTTPSRPPTPPNNMQTTGGRMTQAMPPPPSTSLSRANDFLQTLNKPQTPTAARPVSGGTAIPPVSQGPPTAQQVQAAGQDMQGVGRGVATQQPQPVAPRNNPSAAPTPSPNSGPVVNRTPNTSTPRPQAPLLNSGVSRAPAPVAKI